MNNHSSFRDKNGARNLIFVERAIMTEFQTKAMNGIDHAIAQILHLVHIVINRFDNTL